MALAIISVASPKRMTCGVWRMIKRAASSQRNILAACLLAREAGVSLPAMHQVATTFTGVEHRLQLVREHQGVSYYNDSISTTPEPSVMLSRRR